MFIKCGKLGLCLGTGTGAKRSKYHLARGRKDQTLGGSIFIEAAAHCFKTTGLVSFTDAKKHEHDIASWRYAVEIGPEDGHVDGQAQYGAVSP